MICVTSYWTKILKVLCDKVFDSTDILFNSAYNGVPADVSVVVMGKRKFISF